MTVMAALDANVRNNYKAKANKALRSSGMVPAVIYGPNKQPLTISIEARVVGRLCKQRTFLSTVLDINIDGKKHKVLPKKVDFHPIKDTVLHIDFMYLSNDYQKVSVAIVLEGQDKAVGIKRGGFLNKVIRRVNMLCDVKNIPQEIIKDVTDMQVGTKLKIKDLPTPKKCKFLLNPDTVVASIIGRKGKESEEEEAVEKEEVKAS